MNAVRWVMLIALIAPTRNPSPRDLLNTDRPLTPSEIAAVLNASQRAIAGRTLRLLRGRSTVGGIEVLMGRLGRPRLIHMSGVVEGGIVYGMASGAVGPAPPPPTHYVEKRTTIIDYTARPARRCDGSAMAGELVVRYEYHGAIDAWTATAHAETVETGMVMWTHPFRMLSGVTPVTSGERKPIDGRWARGFVARWTPPHGGPQQVELTGDPLPNVIGARAPWVPIQTLWIDTKSLLPVRWETSDLGDDYTLTYERLDPRPPAGVRAPDCIN